MVFTFHSPKKLLAHKIDRFLSAYSKYRIMFTVKLILLGYEGKISK